MSRIIVLTIPMTGRHFNSSPCRDQLLNEFYTRITPDFCTKLIRGTERYLNEQIQKDPDFMHLGRIGEFVDPPSVHRSDEIIDLTCIEDEHDDDLDDTPDE